jgi:hypothetical protein
LQASFLTQTFIPCHSYRYNKKDDISLDIEQHSLHEDPWMNFPSLKALLRDRIDWDIGKPMIDIEIEHCYPSGTGGNKNKAICKIADRVSLGAKQVEDASIFSTFHSLWEEQGAPLMVKREQLEESFLNSTAWNVLNHTWE